MLLRSGILMVVVACLCLQVNAQTFEDISIESGINHRQVFTGLMGGGVALFDYDNDGYLDIYLTGGHGEDRMFRNNGDFTFDDVTLSTGIGEVSDYVTMGVAIGDINNDGQKDIFLTTGNVTSNLLLINDGQGHFSNISMAAGITQENNSMSASFGDFNLDGYLDIYVANFVEKSNFIFDYNGKVIGFDPLCYSNSLYLNNKNNTFTEVASQYGVDSKGCSLATSFTDFDGDADVDIYIANDFGEWNIPNVLLENHFPEVGFEDVGEQSGADVAIYGMGVAIGDYDEDGDLDYYTTNMGTNVLLNNNGDKTFEDKSAYAGVENTMAGSLLAVSWGAVFMDYDNDSYLDLFVANGELPSFDFVDNSPINPNKLYKNNTDGTFSDVSDLENFNDPSRGRGLVYGDLDNDGDLDLVSTVVERYSTNFIHTQVFRNNTANTNNWLKLQLIGNESNRDGYGARVYLHIEGRSLIREVDGGSSYVSHNSEIVHFGLGQSNNVDSLTIVWPGGNTQHVEGIEANRFYIVNEEISDLETDANICIGKSSKITLNRPIIGNEYYLINETSGMVIDGPIICVESILEFETGAAEKNSRYKILSKNIDQNYISRLDTIIEKNTDFEVQVELVDGLLKASSGVNYSWYLDNEALNLYTREIEATESGYYHVVVSNDYGCEAQSDNFLILPTAIKEPIDLKYFRVFPNPTQGILRISAQNGNLKLSSLKLYNMMGEEANVKYSVMNNEIILDIVNNLRGMYVLVVLEGDNTTKHLIVKK